MKSTEVTTYAIPGENAGVWFLPGSGMGAVLRVKEAESDPAWSTGDSWLHGMVDASRAADKNY